MARSLLNDFYASEIVLMKWQNEFSWETKGTSWWRVLTSARQGERPPFFAPGHILKPCTTLRNPFGDYNVFFAKMKRLKAKYDY